MVRENGSVNMKDIPSGWEDDETTQARKELKKVRKDELIERLLMLSKLADQAEDLQKQLETEKKETRKLTRRISEYQNQGKTCIDDRKELIKWAKAQKIRAFELDGLKVEFLPAAFADTVPSGIPSLPNEEELTDEEKEKQLNDLLFHSAG